VLLGALDLALIYKYNKADFCSSSLCIFKSILAYFDNKLSRFTSESYTSRARKIALKYPFISTVWIQVNFWTLAYLLLFAIVYLGSRGLFRNLGLEYDFSFLPPFFLALFLGAGYGLIMGVVYFYFDGPFFRDRPFWRIVLYQLILSMITLSILLAFMRFQYIDLLAHYLLNENNIIITQAGWPFFYSMIIIYTIIMSILIGFINQMNKKFGPGILIPMFLGRFRVPREVEHIFMFLDLKNSTSIAEKLGHVKYSELVRDCFVDINLIVQKHNAFIYQYVGDEIVLSWDILDGLNNADAIRFYYSCRKQFYERENYYQSKYGLLPEFKAGAHSGKVTVVEVGEIKRDLAFHGDALNVASRIENLCTALNKDLLISETLKSMLGKVSGIEFHSIGLQDLKGKKESLEIFEVIPTN
jgi:adenylate cyclase